MALLYMDSFDHYLTADLLQKWTTLVGVPTILAAAGRRSSAGLRMVSDNGANFNAVAVKGLPASGPTAIIGCAVRLDFPGGSNAIRILGIYDGGTNRDQIVIRANRDGSLTAIAGTNITGPPGTIDHSIILGTSTAGVITANSYAYVELKVTLAASGSLILRVNGVVVLNLPGVNTAFNGPVVWTSMWLGVGTNNSVTISFDDLYVCDGTGAAPWNTFLGDCRVDPRLPTGVGASSGWTPTSGANWTNVDDATPNGDTDTITAATVGLTDSYVTQDAPVPGAPILGVQHCFSVKKLDAGACTIAPIVRHGGTNFPGVDLSPGTTYGYALAPQQVNPGTGAAWVEADFNAAEFGVRKTL